MLLANFKPVPFMRRLLGTITILNTGKHTVHFITQSVNSQYLKGNGKSSSTRITSLRFRIAAFLRTLIA